MTPPEFLYFDLGNVLVTFCNDRMVRQMAAVAGVDADVVRRLLFAAGDQTDVQWRLECGRITADEYYEWFCQATGTRPDRRRLELACGDIFGPIQESLALVAALAGAGHRLGILSNTNAVHWPLLIDGRFPELNDAFELYVTSFDAAAMKPDPVIYHHAARQAGAPPSAIFFVDDRTENVAGAAAAGFDAVVFTSTEQLERDLRDRGVEW